MPPPPQRTTPTHQDVLDGLEVQDDGSLLRKRQRQQQHRVAAEVAQRAGRGGQEVDEAERGDEQPLRHDVKCGAGRGRHAELVQGGSDAIKECHGQHHCRPSRRPAQQRAHPRHQRQPRRPAPRRQQPVILTPLGLAVGPGAAAAIAATAARAVCRHEHGAAVAAAPAVAVADAWRERAPAAGMRLLHASQAAVPGRAPACCCCCRCQQLSCR